MSRVSRNEANDTRSVLATAELLRSVIASGGAPIYGGLSPVLKSQSSLASHADQERRIVPMSLNHMKRVSVQALGSFDVIDRLRLQAKSSLLSETLSKSRRSDLEQARYELDVERHANARLREDLLLLQRAYDARCRQAFRYAKSASDACVDMCRKEQVELDRGLQYRSLPASKDNLVPFPRTFDQ